jgi:hypothetical protein
MFRGDLVILDFRRFLRATCARGKVRGNESAGRIVAVLQEEKHGTEKETDQRLAQGTSQP